MQVKDRATSVIDLQWDRLSAVYMLVAYQSFLSLWDTESGTEVHVFERQSTGISCLAWMDWTAGNFISANSKTGVVKVWNASQKQPLDSIRVHTAGITCVHFALGSSRLLCGAVDGSVVVYHMLRRQVEYSTCAGHTDTIFDCRLSPSSPDVLGTCSYDSTVKIWNMSDLTLKKTLYGPQCIIYSCSWSPNSSMMAASTISGRVIVWDVVSGKELVQYHHHKKASYCIDWNILMPDVLLTTSADGTAVVIKIDPEAVKESPLSGTGAIGSRRRKNTTAKDIAVPISTTRYEHPGPVYGGYWSPNVEDIFATACQDSLVRVFRYRGVLAPLFQLQGHSARAFNVSWSSLLPGLLASGSDDHLVMIWEVPRLLELSTTGDLPPSNTVLQPVKRLVGHTSNVRALSWNHEHRQVLISGSWDSTIRVWNAATGVCLQIISDHVADVYTVASHPRRPFTYVSCSRDSTLRVWELEGFVVRARLRAISDGYLEGILRSTEDVEAERGLPVGTILGSLPSAIEAVLGGEGSRALTRQFRCAASAGPAMFGDRKRIANGEELAVMYKALYDFFCGSNGCLNLWDCVIEYCRAQEGSAGGAKGTSYGCAYSAVPEQMIIATVKSDARQLEAVKMGVRRGDLTGKVEENLRKAAMKFAQTGDFVKYCALMVEIGDWTAALAMAPAVSMEYWQHLTELHASHLEGNLSEYCVPYYLACGQDARAVKFYMDRDEPTSAMVVAKMSESRDDLVPNMVIPTPDTESRSPVTTRTDSPGANWIGARNTAFRGRTETEVELSRRAIRQVTLHQVDTSVCRGRPINAAAHLVSIGEVDAAVALLIRSDETDMAFAVAECCSLNTQPIARLMAEKAESLQDLELAVGILQRMCGATGDGLEQECALLLSRHSPIPATDPDLPLPSKHRTHLDLAAEAAAIGKDEDALVNYVLGMDVTAAARVVVDRLARHISDPLNLPNAAANILTSAKYIRASLIEEELRHRFLCFVFWFGAHRAIKMGFWDVAWSMLRSASSLAVNCDFPLSREKMAVHALCVRIQYRDPDCVAAIDDLLEGGTFANVDKRSTSGVGDLVGSPLRAIEALITVVQAMRTVKRLILDATVSDTWSIAGRTPWSMYARPLYGILTGLIEEELRHIATTLGLPVLPSTLPDAPAGQASIFRVPFGQSCLSAIEYHPIVVQGSVLPVANQNLKKTMSCVTGRRFQGPVLLLGDQLTVIGKNEALMWKLVNPFSPLGNGDFIDI